MTKNTRTRDSQDSGFPGASNPFTLKTVTILF